jgi:anti-sigma factor RsiW
MTMGDEARHPTETLQDALDRRLDPVALAELNTHLSSCASCRRELEALRWAKERAASLASFDEPADLDARLRTALDGEDRARASSGARSRRLIFWLAAAAALAAAVWIGGRLRTVSAPDSVASTYRAYGSRALPLEIASGEPVEIERHLARALPFPTRVFDLGMMGFALEGGRVQEVAGREGALIAYRAADGRVLLCQMYEGSVSDLPAPVERRTNEGITFQIYRDGEVNLIFWQEGGVVCVLAADGDLEAALQLAFAKAVRI